MSNMCSFSPSPMPNGRPLYWLHNQAVHSSRGSPEPVGLSSVTRVFAAPGPSAAIDPEKRHRRFPAAGTGSTSQRAGLRWPRTLQRFGLRREVREGAHPGRDGGRRRSRFTSRSDGTRQEQQRETGTIITCSPNELKATLVTETTEAGSSELRRPTPEPASSTHHVQDEE